MMDDSDDPFASPDNLLTVGQVAYHLNVGDETVRRWLRSGELQGIRLSRKAGWRILASDYFDFLDAAAAASGSRGRVLRPWLRVQEEDEEEQEEDEDEVTDEASPE